MMKDASVGGNCISMRERAAEQQKGQPVKSLSNVTPKLVSKHQLLPSTRESLVDCVALMRAFNNRLLHSLSLVFIGERARAFQFILLLLLSKLLFIVFCVHIFTHSLLTQQILIKFFDDLIEFIWLSSSIIEQLIIITITNKAAPRPSIFCLTHHTSLRV